MIEACSFWITYWNFMLMYVWWLNNSQSCLLPPFFEIFEDFHFSHFSIFGFFSNGYFNAHVRWKNSLAEMLFRFLFFIFWFVLCGFVWVLSVASTLYRVDNMGNSCTSRYMWSCSFKKNIITFRLKMGTIIPFDVKRFKWF